MNNKLHIFIFFFTFSLIAYANQQPTSNDNPAYGQSNVQAQLRLNIRDNAEVVHFVRDTNDPKIITKTYVLKHASPYSIRSYLREMVQTHRVEYNNDAGHKNADYYNVYSKNGKTGNKIFIPTGVECITFADGTGIIMVSAEEYRFQSNENGMGIDELVETLDSPDIAHSSGQAKYIYFPANRNAKELQSMLKLVGANLSNDTAELLGGKDKIEVDNDLNCLFFNTALYSRKNIEKMLKHYDIAHPEIKISCTVYELNAENDGMLGLDFQSWKNNDGFKLFQTGAKYSHNHNLSDLLGLARPDGTINTHYLNFEPKWNTKFLDFLVSKGKANVLSTGELTIKNGTTGTLKRSSGVLFAELQEIETTIDNIEHGNEVNVRPINDNFKFELKITPTVMKKATTLDIKIATRTLLGYTSTGTVRASDYESNQTVTIGHSNNRLYLGGIEKTQIVSDSGGIPFLKDLPGLGWLFSTERQSTKKSQIVVVADCSIIKPDSILNDKDLEQINKIRQATENTGEHNSYGYRQYLIDNER